MYPNKFSYVAPDVATERGSVHAAVGIAVVATDISAKQKSLCRAILHAHQGTFWQTQPFSFCPANFLAFNTAIYLPIKPTVDETVQSSYNCSYSSTCNICANFEANKAKESYKSTFYRPSNISAIFSS